MNDENFYYLMHKNDVVAGISIDEISGSITKISAKVNKELLPLGGNLSAADFKKWWKRRAVPINQGSIKKILKTNKLATTQSYLTTNLGLSLNDHYWIRPLNQPYSWEEINLFTNPFKDNITELQLVSSTFSKSKPSVLDLYKQTTFYPSASLQGELQKKWILKNNEQYLIKGNYGNSYQQSINEVFASLLHRKQDKIPFTPYQLCTINMNNQETLGCICKNFANTTIEFIPAYEVVSSSKKKNEQSEYEHFIDLCVLHGLKENQVREFLEYQILSDFILTNTDRHFNNFGVLRDSETLKFVGMAPIFDSGNSLFWNGSGLVQNNDLLNISVNSFKKKETDLLKYVKNPILLNLDLLPTDTEFLHLFCKNNTTGEHLQNILLNYHKKIDLLSRFQYGEKIFSYGYHF